MSDKKKNINALLGKINKKFGDNAVAFVSDVEEKLTIRKIQTPSNDFNAMLYGGIVKGAVIELLGEESSGKTMMAIQTIVEEQKKDPENHYTCWFETEGSIDINDLKMYGVNTDRIVYMDQRETGAEQALDITRALVSSGEFDIIVVNSVAGLSPKCEIESDLEKANMAVTARMLSKYFRIIIGAAKKNNTTMIFINQLRSNMAQYGSPVSGTGR
jgi:recombination protein RecA